MRDVVAGLAVEDPQHPPLYFVLERGWQKVFGDSTVARRGLAALFGTLAILCAYLFGMALARRVTFAIVLAALVAVSPFHVLYAQQAREYSLWTCLIFLSSVALLRALAAPSALRFALYGLTIALGLYSDLLFAYTLVAYAVFVVVVYRRQFRKVVVPFAIASLAALATFAPWIAVLVHGRSSITNNTYLGSPLPLKLFALKWIFNVGAVFYDLDYEKHATVVLLIPVFGVLVAGGLLLARGPDRRVALFVAMLGATALAFLVPDIVRHESRSTSSRYLIPTWIAVECAAAYAIFCWSQSNRTSVRRGGALAFVGLALLGVVSLGVAAQRSSWWGDGSAAPIGPISRVLRAAKPPVSVVFVIDHSVFWDFGPVLFADTVDPAIRLTYLRPHETLAKPRIAGSVFVLDPSRAALAAFERSGWRTEPAYRFTTADTAVAAMRVQAASRRGDSADASASLWRLR